MTPGDQRSLRKLLDRVQAQRQAAERPTEADDWPPVTEPGSGARLPQDDHDPNKYSDDDTEEN